MCNFSRAWRGAWHFKIHRRIVVARCWPEKTIYDFVWLHLAYSKKKQNPCCGVYFLSTRRSTGWWYSKYIILNGCYFLKRMEYWYNSCTVFKPIQYHIMSYFNIGPIILHTLLQLGRHGLIASPWKFNRRSDKLSHFVLYIQPWRWNW